MLLGNHVPTKEAIEHQAEEVTLQQLQELFEESLKDNIDTLTSCSFNAVLDLKTKNRRTGEYMHTDTLILFKMFESGYIRGIKNISGEYQD